jgi:hypothetical protein
MLAKLFMIAFMLSVTAMAAPLTEGPGRSGGGNGIFKAQPKGALLDSVETANMVPIKSWKDEVPAFERLKKRLRKFPDLQAYLLNVLEEKPWYWTLQSLDEQSCYNATLGGPQKDVQIVACQWEDHGVMSAQRLQGLSPDAQEQLLVHEGLVNHMVVTLNKLDKMAKKSSVDKRQQTVEFEIHRISSKIMAGQYKNMVELNKELDKIEMPLVMTEQDQKKLESADGGIRAKEIYLGGREKTEMMKRRFESAKPVDIAAMSAVMGNEACFLSADGYSVPGYFSGAYLKLDEMFPAATFSVYAFRDIELEKTILSRSMEMIFEQKSMLIPLEKRDGDLSGAAEIRPQALFDEMFRKIKDPATRAQVEEIMRKKNPGINFDAIRRIRLTIRALGEIKGIEQYLIFRREVFIYDGTRFKLETEDFMAGKMMPYPACLSIY